MTRIHVFCEGQTEETFVRELLQDHFNRKNIYLSPIVLRTGKKGKGGVTSYGKIKNQVIRKCREDKGAFVTSMIDYYALPSDFPGKQDVNPGLSSIQKAKKIQKTFQLDINEKNFIANLVVHEFEGLLFSDITAFEDWFEDKEIKALEKECKGFKTPEHINDNPDTAPSKRILKHCYAYDKITHGSLIALDIGLDTIRKKCPLFDQWIKKLELVGDASE